MVQYDLEASEAKAQRVSHTISLLNETMNAFLRQRTPLENMRLTDDDSDSCIVAIEDFFQNKRALTYNHA